MSTPTHASRVKFLGHLRVTFEVTSDVVSMQTLFTANSFAQTDHRVVRVGSAEDSYKCPHSLTAPRSDSSAPELSGPVPQW